MEQIECIKGTYLENDLLALLLELQNKAKNLTVRLPDTFPLQLFAPVPERQTVDESYKEKLPHVPLNFNDGKLAFAAKSTPDLVRTWAVLSACQIPALVEHADKLLHWGKKTFGSWIVNSVVRATFFNHFCAGTLLSLDFFSSSSYWTDKVYIDGQLIHDRIARPIVATESSISCIAWPMQSNYK